MKLPKITKPTSLNSPSKLAKLPKPKSLADLKPSDPEPDPLAGVEYTGTVEEDSKRELTALEQGYRDRAKNEAKRFKQATDSEYWFAVCFSSREEKDAFLAAIGWQKNQGDKYLAGQDFAHHLNIKM